eukprot:SAG22_NODE_150_length_17426_cov_8.082588_8_plen_96_part_00
MTSLAKYDDESVPVRKSTPFLEAIDGTTSVIEFAVAVSPRTAPANMAAYDSHAGAAALDGGSCVLPTTLTSRIGKLAINCPMVTLALCGPLLGRT